MNYQIFIKSLLNKFIVIKSNRKRKFDVDNDMVDIKFLKSRKYNNSEISLRN